MSKLSEHVNIAYRTIDFRYTDPRVIAVSVPRFVLYGAYGFEGRAVLREVSQLSLLL